MYHTYDVHYGDFTEIKRRHPEDESLNFYDERHYNRRRIIKRDGLCVYCGCSDPHKLCADHLIPISRRVFKYGVRFRLVHLDSNLVAACIGCNTQKGNMGIDEFLEQYPIFIESFLNHARFLSDSIKELLRPIIENYENGYYQMANSE